MTRWLQRNTETMTCHQYSQGSDVTSATPTAEMSLPALVLLTWKLSLHTRMWQSGWGSELTITSCTFLSLESKLQKMSALCFNLVKEWFLLIETYGCIVHNWKIVVVEYWTCISAKLALLWKWSHLQLLQCSLQNDWSAHLPFTGLTELCCCQNVILFTWFFFAFLPLCLYRKSFLNIS